MNRNFILSLGLFVLLTVKASAQKEDYKKVSSDYRKAIWGWNKPEFATVAVPAEYNKYSTVVIARHIEIAAELKSRAGVTGAAFSPFRANDITEIFREKLKINDRSAVEDYSEFSFSQLQRKIHWAGSSQTTIWVGVRVIKPDGSVKEINADDVVLTKNEVSSKEAKIAVPDLAVGDMIDYYIVKQVRADQAAAIPPYAFTFFDDVPIMNYSVRCELSGKYAAEFRAYNGAPDFKVSKEGDGNVLEAARKNIPAYPANNIWVSTIRQLPVLRMNIIRGYKGPGTRKSNVRRPGEVYKSQPSEEYFEDILIDIAEKKNAWVAAKYKPDVPKKLSDHYKKYKSRMKGQPDSLAAELFYIFRFERAFYAASNIEVDDFVNRTKWELDNTIVSFELGEFLKNEDLGNKLVYSTSKYGPEMNEILSTTDVESMVMLKTPKARVLSMPSFFTTAFFIPPQHEFSKKVETVDHFGRQEFKPKNFERTTTNLPGSKAEDNYHVDKLAINLGTGTDLHINRTTVINGHYKEDAQKQLILLEDFYEHERKLFGLDENLFEDLKDRKLKKYADEVQIACNLARKNHKNAFIAEAKNWFETDINNLTNHRILNMGVRHQSPEFIYASEFDVPNLVKKAGNNLIVDIGKLQGSPLQITEAQKSRTLDVYAPFARTIRYEITFKIPEGYTAEGLQSLQKNVDNEAGKFIVDAKTEGQNVVINVTKQYKNAFEKAQNWDKLVAMMDASVEWTGAKLLLKKK